MLNKIDIEKTLQLQPNTECLFASLATVLNEVVDTVNELTEHFADASKMIKATEITPDIREKWIGKICKFWDNDDAEDNIEYGVLTAISTDYGVGYCCNDEYEYDNCQPVKPDSELIYHGE